MEWNNYKDKFSQSAGIFDAMTLFLKSCYNSVVFTYFKPSTAAHCITITKFKWPESH